MSENETNDDCEVVKRHHDYKTKSDYKNVVVNVYRHDHANENVVASAWHHDVETRVESPA